MLILFTTDSLLPGQVGQHGPYTAMDGDYIQEFFSDGKFLLGLTNTTLTGALEVCLRRPIYHWQD